MWNFFFDRRTCIATLLLGSAMGGFAQAILWIGQGEYISLCATESTKGFYFGFFWVFFMTSELAGNAVGGEIITRTSGPKFYLFMGGIMLIAVIAFCFVIVP
jgi:hypothetical protein